MVKLNTLNLLKYGRSNLIRIKSIEYMTGTLYCCMISYFIALALSPNILFHTDTFAPIEEIKSLINIKNIGLSQLHLARIPSIFPDLAIIYIFIKFFKITNIYTIISSYSIVNSFFLLFFPALISSLFIKKRFSFLYSSVALSIISLFLINKSSFYRDSLAHYLTPLHQGGNIVMTFICIFLLFSLFLDGKKGFLFHTILFYLMPFLIGFSLTSNKLFAFTFIAPIFLSIIYLNIISTNNLLANLRHKLNKVLYCFVNRNAIRINFNLVDIINKIRNQKILIASLIIFISAFSFQYFLDLQCLDPISFKFYKPIEQFYDLTVSFRGLMTFFLFNIFFTIYSIYLLCINLKQREGLLLNDKNRPMIVNLSFLSFFIGSTSLSPLFYIWFTNNLITRYLLVLPLFMPLALFIFLNLLFLHLQWNLFNTNISRLLNIFYVTLLTFLLIYSLRNHLILNMTKNNLLQPTDIFYKEALRQRGDYTRDYKQIKSLGLHNGLSDFWGSSVSYFGEEQINVSPILANGTPNLWAHNINFFMNQDTGKLRNYNFIYSRNIDFSKSIIGIFGQPDKIYKIEDESIYPVLQDSLQLNLESHFIFIYNNQEFKNKIALLFNDRVSNGCRNY